MIIGVAQFEKLFRKAASLDVDKNDLKRLSNFVVRKLADMLIVAKAAAKQNDRDIIFLYDLPITKGLQETMHEFKKLEEEIELKPILTELAKLPDYDVVLTVDVEERLPEIVGALIIALARTMKVIDPKLKNPQTEHWDRAEAIFSMLL
ncbi:MAG: DUF1931 family protein [Chlorobi bacterium]|nr:DUF1931 family protein [Chlorobiota bacterium]